MMARRAATTSHQASPASPSSSSLSLLQLLVVAVLVASSTLVSVVEGTGFIDACIAVEYEDDLNAVNSSLVFHADPKVHHNGHNVFSSSGQYGGQNLFFVTQMTMKTLMGELNNVSGWALDPRIKTDTPSYFLGSCSEEDGNMGPDTCTVTYHHLTNFYERQLMADRMHCIACSDDYYLVTTLTKNSYCAPKRPSGSTCLSSEECDSSLCWGYHCCNGSVRFNTSCSACDVSGECVCDYEKLCERVGTALYCKDQDLMSAPCSIPPNTTQLDLQNNSLTSIPQHLISSLPNLESLCLADNPLDCCGVSFLSQASYLDLGCKKESTCTYSSMPLVHVPVNSIHQSDVNRLCGDDPESSGDTADLSRILGAIVFCICVAAIAAFVYWRHKRKQRTQSLSKDEIAALLRVNGDSSSTDDYVSYGTSEKEKKKKGSGDVAATVVVVSSSQYSSGKK